MIHLLWIAVVTLITFSVILAKPQWAEKVVKKRTRTNDKYKLPAQFWKDLNEAELMLLMMHNDNAESVFRFISNMSDKYMKYYMNTNYDYHMTRIIKKYNDQIFLLTKTK